MSISHRPPPNTRVCLDQYLGLLDLRGLRIQAADHQGRARLYELHGERVHFRGVRLGGAHEVLEVRQRWRVGSRQGSRPDLVLTDVHPRCRAGCGTRRRKECGQAPAGRHRSRLSKLSAIKWHQSVRAPSLMTGMRAGMS